MSVNGSTLTGMSQPDRTASGEWGQIAWAKILLRVLITLAAVLAFLQPIFAGSYLSGHYDALNLHYVNAFIATGATLLSALAGLVTWRRGGGAGWPAATCFFMFAVECVQIVLGYELVLALHIVTGSLIVTAYVVLLVRVWRPESKSARASATHAA